MHHMLVDFQAQEQISLQAKLYPIKYCQSNDYKTSNRNCQGSSELKARQKSFESRPPSWILQIPVGLVVESRAVLCVQVTGDQF